MFRDAFPIIYVEDLAASLTFYRDLLGFSETYRFPAGEAAEFVALSLGESAGLALAAVTDGQVGAHGRTIQPRVGRRFELCVYTDDVDHAVDRLRGQGRRCWPSLPTSRGVSGWHTSPTRMGIRS